MTGSGSAYFALADTEAQAVCLASAVRARGAAAEVVRVLDARRSHERRHPMKVTNVSVKLSPQSTDRLKAFCTMTLDGEFVVRDLKIIEGTSGLFVAMPSRKLTDHCPKCNGKNHLRAKFCNDCGAKMPEKRISDEDIQGKLHADIAHPINSDCRGRLQEVDPERLPRGTPGRRPGR